MYGVNTFSDQENSSEKMPIDTTVPSARSRVLFTQPCEVVCGYYTPVPDGDTEAQQGGAPLHPCGAPSHKPVLLTSAHSVLPSLLCSTSHARQGLQNPKYCYLLFALNRFYGL